MWLMGSTGILKQIWGEPHSKSEGVTFLMWNLWRDGRLGLGFSLPSCGEAICGFIPCSAQPHFLSGTDYGVLEWQEDRAANLQPQWLFSALYLQSWRCFWGTRAPWTGFCGALVAQLEQSSVGTWHGVTWYSWVIPLDFQCYFCPCESFWLQRGIRGWLPLCCLPGKGDHALGMVGMSCGQPEELSEAGGVWNACSVVSPDNQTRNEREPGGSCSLTLGGL